jgi:phosphoenolpyruvate carboxykinase (GTP)
MPRHEDLEWSGLGLTPQRFEELMLLDRDAWSQEFAAHRDLFRNLENHLPEELMIRHEALVAGLDQAPGPWSAR